jgi:hypothetical protein
MPFLLQVVVVEVMQQVVVAVQVDCLLLHHNLFLQLDIQLLLAQVVLVD